MANNPQQKYKPGLHSVAYVTTPNEESALKLSRKLVERKLAACVNIVPRVVSIYEWEGKINEHHEILLVIKTRTTRVDELCQFVRENHPYSVAEVVALPIENGNPAYLTWLSKAVPRGSIELIAWLWFDGKKFTNAIKQ
nr:protein CutA homolog [Aedes albopictus]XP_029736230.1 protein CutA homolog [Aedes albopictus]